jgi:hypothetical protein
MRTNELINHLDGLRRDLETGKIVHMHDEVLEYYAEIVAKALYTLVDMDK